MTISVGGPGTRRQKPSLPDSPTPGVAEASTSDDRLTFAQRFRFVAGKPDLRRLWIGRSTSVIGDRMFAVGAIWIAWSLTHSSAGVACIILAESLPFVLWGVLRRRVTIRVGTRMLSALDVMRAALLGVLLWLPLTGGVGKTSAVLLVAAVAFLTAIFEPAFRSLIPELVPGEGRQAYASFDLGGRLARIAGPLLAAAITWAGSPRILIGVDLATFFVSAACLYRIAEPNALSQAQHAARRLVPMERLPSLSQTLIWANGLGTFALIVWWLALPQAAGRHPDGATTYALCVGIGAAGGIIGNLLLSRAPKRWKPATLCTAGWIVAGFCIGALILKPSPVALETISFVSGFALATAALGFSFHAADLDLSQRDQLFQRDQVIMRTAGSGSAIAGAAVLEFLPVLALTGTAALLVFVAAMIAYQSAPHRSASLDRPGANQTTSEKA